MKFFVSFVFTALLATSLLAQQAEVKVEDGVPSTVAIWSPAFTAMCRSLGARLGAGLGETVTLKPKRLPPSRERYLGDVWQATLRGGAKTLDVPAAELPPVLQRLRGSAVRGVALGTCYLKDNYFYSTEHFVLVAYTKEDAEAIAAALR